MLSRGQDRHAYGKRSRQQVSAERTTRYWPVRLERDGRLVPALPIEEHVPRRAARAAADPQGRSIHGDSCTA
jgi:hypothetical protein